MSMTWGERIIGALFGAFIVGMFVLIGLAVRAEIATCRREFPKVPVAQCALSDKYRVVNLEARP